MYLQIDDRRTVVTILFIAVIGAAFLFGLFSVGVYETKQALKANVATVGITEDVQKNVERQIIATPVSADPKKQNQNKLNELKNAVNMSLYAKDNVQFLEKARDIARSIDPKYLSGASLVEYNTLAALLGVAAVGAAVLGQRMKKTFTKEELEKDAKYYSGHLNKLDARAIAENKALLIYEKDGEKVNFIGELSSSGRGWLAENKKTASDELYSIIKEDGAGKKGFGKFRGYIETETK